MLINDLREESLKLKIAGVVILLQSKFRMDELIEDKKGELSFRRFKSFVYQGHAPADITIKINVCPKLPEVLEKKVLFVSYHPEDDSENWRLIKHGVGMVYRCVVPNKNQLYYINPGFNKVEGYLLSRFDNQLTWQAGDVIYDFIQVLLINYLALHKKGFIVHSVGIKDPDGRGLLFPGESGAGKSTMARLWDKHSRGSVLNDDRVIVRKDKKGFFICGTPWHGDFHDYLGTRIEEVRVSRLLFIYHSPVNTAKPVLPGEAFRLLYPSLFPTFWSRKLLGELISLSMGFVNSTQSFRLGFVKSKSVIGFIREL